MLAELHQDGGAAVSPAPVKLKKKTPARSVNINWFYQPQILDILVREFAYNIL